MAFVHAFATAPKRWGLAVVQPRYVRIKDRKVSSRRVSVCMKAGDERESAEEEKRLQNDKPFVLREFGKIAMAAFGIGLLLFFFDILVSLVVTSLGVLYAIAVLLEVRGADTVLSRIVGGVNSAWWATKSRVQQGYRSVRRQVRKGLED